MATVLIHPPGRWISLTSIGLFLLCGCHAAAGRPDAIPELRASSAQTSALIETAREGMAKVKALAESSGISGWLEAIDLILSRASTSAAATERIVGIEQGQKAEVAAENLTLKGEVAELKSSWGHRLQVWATRFFWLLVGLLAAHVLLSGLGLLISGPIGAGLSVAGRIINPAGWVSTVADNLYFRGKVPASK